MVRWESRIGQPRAIQLRERPPLSLSVPCHRSLSFPPPSPAGPRAQERERVRESGRQGKEADVFSRCTIPPEGARGTLHRSITATPSLFRCVIAADTGKAFALITAGGANFVFPEGWKGWLDLPMSFLTAPSTQAETSAADSSQGRETESLLLLCNSEAYNRT